MATEAIKSTQITNRDAVPQLLNDPGNAGAKYANLQAVCAATTGKTLGSTYRFFQVPSNAVISSLKLWCQALSTSTAIDIGVYDTTLNGGAVVDQDRFAAAVAVASAVNDTEERYNALAISTAGKQLWDLLGLSADPSKSYDIVVTNTTTITAGGNIVLHCQYGF